MYLSPLLGFNLAAGASLSSTSGIIFLIIFAKSDIDLALPYVILNVFDLASLYINVL